MYPRYGLETLSRASGQWGPCAGTEVSNRPHHYDHLRAQFDRLVAMAKLDQRGPLGYRIVCEATPVDTWERTER